MLNQFEDTVAAALQDCPPGTVCLAAVSGGADSTAMLAALAAVKKQGAAFDLRCIHVEHGIRPAAESRGDADFVRSLCEKCNVPCRVVSISPGKIARAAKKRGIGIEAAARPYRRRAWFREAASCGAPNLPVRILVAHTADDMLETALMRILRGAGPSGLAAMPVKKTHGETAILRPLLTRSRAEVLAYLAEKKIPWQEDSTNADTQFLRNRIRRRLIPLLNEQFPQWRTGIASLAETQSLAADFLQTEAAARIHWQPLFENASRKDAEDAKEYRRLGGERGISELRPNLPKSLRLCASAPLREKIPNMLCTEADNFFAQPAIIREEALFQGIDRLLAGTALSATVRRVNIRRFCGGKVTAVDLGPLEIRKKAGLVLLIIAPGLYTLKGTHV